jgi:hypothetical protein
MEFKNHWNFGLVEFNSNSIEGETGCKLVQKVLKISLSFPSFVTNDFFFFLPNFLMFCHWLASQEGINIKWK